MGRRRVHDPVGLVLLDPTDRVLVQGIGSRQAQLHAGLMRAYGTRVVAGVADGRGGARLADVPVFDTVRAAVDATGASVSSVFLRGDRALDGVLEAIDGGIRLVHLPAEGVPYRDVSIMIAHAARSGASLVGPNSQGIVLPGRAKVGASGGDRPERMFRRGRVAVISRSGGMGGEICWSLSRQGIGQSVYLSTGGDLLVGTPLPTGVQLAEADPETEVVVIFGEAGTGYEEEVARMRSLGEVKKPLVAFVPGSFLESQPTGTTFGHAGALIEGTVGSPLQKRTLLAASGAHLPRRFDEIAACVSAAIGGIAPAECCLNGRSEPRTMRLPQSAASG